MKRARSTVFSAIAAVGLTLIAAGVWLAVPNPEPVPHRGDLPESGIVAAPASSMPADGAPRRPIVLELPPNPPSEDDRAREAKVARRLAELDNELQAATSLSDPSAREQALARVCFHWAEHDPLGAVARASALRLDGNGVLENLTQQWANADLPAAREWVNRLPPGETKGRLVSRIGYLWAQTAPESAANYVLDAMPSGENQAEAAIAVLHQWAQHDREAAAAWAQQFPAGDLRDRALHEISPRTSPVRDRE